MVYIIHKLSSFLTIDPVIVFLSVIATSSRDLVHNGDGICKIPSPVFCLLVGSPSSGILNYIHKVTSTQQRCPRVALINRISRVPLNYRLGAISHSFQSMSYAHCWRTYCYCEMQNSNNSVVPFLEIMSKYNVE